LLGGKLALGLKGGISSNVENNDEFENSIRYQSDPVTSSLPSRENILVPNFGVGFFYYNQKFFFGGSIPLLLSTEENTDGSKPSITHNFDSYNYFFNTGYRFGEMGGIKFIPSVLMLYTKNSRAQYIGNINVEFLEDRLSLGAGYRAGKAMLFSAQFKVNEQLRIGYTYDYTFDVFKSLGQWHEIMLRYEFKYIIKASSPLDF
jgi:type IX secretion system PorP/SprF family membrane protein